MKHFFVIGVLLLFSVSSLCYSADEFSILTKPQDTTNFVGYASNRILVKFDPKIMGMLHREKFSSGRTGIPALDIVGDRFAVKSIRAQFPNSHKKRKRGHDKLEGWHKIHFPEKKDILSAVEEYRQLPIVLDAQPVPIHRIYADPQEQFYNYQWHLPMIQAPEAWEIETGNSEIIVAILDTGVRYFAKDLGGENASSNFTPNDINGNIWINMAEKNGDPDNDDDGNGYVDDWIGWDFVNDTEDDSSGFIYCYEAGGEDCGTPDNDPRDFNGHGTHCAGIVSAMNNNNEAVASLAGGWHNGFSEIYGNGVKIMPLRVGWSAVYVLFEVGLVSMDAAAEALYYAADNGANIASCSWGSENVTYLTDAINYFVNNGGLIFNAAGNDPTLPPDYMAGLSEVITVAATDQNDCKASFSNYGPWVDISAPGVEIYSLYHDHYNPGTDYVAAMDGTSMATPLAAAVAALIWSQNTDWDADQVRQQLLNSADPIDSLSCNSSYAGSLGYGRVNAFKAVSWGEDTDDDGDGYTVSQGDCNDADNTVYPGAPELCDQNDNNCDGNSDEGLSVDADGDGHYTEDSCQTPSDDCNDADGTIYPGASELNDGIDNDCNGQIDEGLQTYYYDFDGDGYGNANESIKATSQPIGYVADNTDCNDNNESIYPNAEEICGDDIDQDCSGEDLICPDFTECFKGKPDGVCHPKEVGTNCPDCSISWVCGDGVCNGDENSDNCAIDCGYPSAPETSCYDGKDNDGDDWIDCADADCSNDPVCLSCLPRKESCSSNDDCCSGRCFRGACK